MKRALLAVLASGLLFAAGAGAEPPTVDHQPSPCTVPDQPIGLCATVTDDGQVTKVRLYFRPEGDKFWQVVDMTFNGINFCGTLPAPRPGRLRTVEYYVQAVDDQYESQRTSTFQLAVQPPDQCGFPPVEKDPARLSQITVYATNAKQGKKLSDDFELTGVTFVPFGTK